MLRITPAWGLTDGNAEGLWAQRGGWERAQGGPFRPHARLNAEVGYALGGPKGLGTQMPYAAVNLAGSDQRTLALGWRLRIGPQKNLNIETTQSRNLNSKPDYGIRIQGELRW